MNIAVIGIGEVGATLGRRWAEIGHDVTFGVRDKTAPKVTELLNSISTVANASDICAAIKFSEVVLLAVPYEAVFEIIRTCGDLKDKILIDPTTPIGSHDSLTIGTTSSAAEKIASHTPSAKIVKAFNMTGYLSMDSPRYSDGSASMFICGNDPDAKKVVCQLAAELGFEAIDSGNLKSARYLEPLAMLWIQLARNPEFGPNIAFKLLKR